MKKGNMEGAKIYAEVIGYSCTCINNNLADGFHLTKPAIDGEGAFRAM